MEKRECEFIIIFLSRCSSIHSLGSIVSLNLTWWWWWWWSYTRTILSHSRHHHWASIKFTFLQWRKTTQEKIWSPLNETDDDGDHDFVVVVGTKSSKNSRISHVIERGVGVRKEANKIRMKKKTIMTPLKWFCCFIDSVVWFCFYFAKLRIGFIAIDLV